MTDTNQLNWQRTNLENVETAWEGDLWDRKRWGEGKTWFVRHWQKHLEDENHNVIYLDAFANDYLDDPFLTIAAEISQTFKNSDNIDDADVNSFNNKTASVLISLAAILPVIVAKAGLHWIGLGGAGEVIQEVYKDGKDVYDSVSDEITGKLKEHIEKKIENHHLEKETIQDFKIERIKHFFDIPKIVFVLVMNKKQFIMSIKHFYGYNDDSSKIYLDKFVDFEIPLLNSKNIISKNISSFEIIKQLMLEVGEECSDIHLVFHLAIKENISFRELKKRVNIYALLKQESVYKNLFISLSLVKSNSGLIRSMKDVIISIMKLNGANRNIVDADLRNTHNDDFRYLVDQKYSLKLSVLLEYISDLKEIEIENQKNNSYNYKLLFSTVMNKYALMHEENMEAHIFEQQFIKYLSSSL